ncbi:hypothetical protein ASPFODRAFT_48790 [Aspergillus luchuensis CBS 106.47]|uniref:Uncharacterized protein n=1 Tax=Aspergillus luchuensis (strain CBS 106.47) TaxID=1137211 RepID=A0A1M3TD52_ASPLC|nr:hypothetical protein ASPFODRAFT_48790 [Aspergillus luchuensis CBS 106.47]
MACRTITKRGIPTDITTLLGRHGTYLVPVRHPSSLPVNHIHIGAKDYRSFLGRHAADIGG